MMAARYWRVRFSDSSGGASTDIWLDEVELLDSYMQVIPAAGGVAISSGDYSAAYSKEQAFDGLTTSNGWRGAAGAWPQWIGYVFSAPVVPAHVRLKLPEQASASDELPVVGYIFVDRSTDGVSWVFGAPSVVSGSIAVGQIIVCTVVAGSLPRAIGSIHRTPDLGFDSGPLQITGTTKNTGTPPTPVRRRVRLHEQSSGRIVRETWSDATTGAYTFAGLRQTLYYVTAFDHTGTYGGVIETDVTPAAAP